MQNVVASFTIGQNNPLDIDYTVSSDKTIETEFTINALPMKLSQLEIDRSMPTFVYEQAIASDTWVIVHNLHKKPSVTVVDSADNVVEKAERYIDDNTVEVTFNGEFTGKAYLN